MKFNFSFQNILKIFVYISIIFLGYKLYDLNYLKWKEVVHWKFMMISLLFLLMAFAIQGLRWYKLLKNTIPELSLLNAYRSHGLTILGKYIPGKLWMVIGKAMYINERHDDVSTFNLSLLSLQNQMLALWSGLVIGSLSFIVVYELKYLLITLVLMVFFTGLLFVGNLNHTFSRLFKRYFNKKIVIPFIPFRRLIEIGPVYFLFWIVLAIGFYFFCQSLNFDISIWSSPIFVLAAVIGIASIIAPGGMGIRESVLVLLFVLLDHEKAEVISVSAMSRIWFLLGEIMTFLIAVYLNNFRFY